MSAVKILTALIVTTVVPLWTGTSFLSSEEKGARLPFCWISGQILLWAGFLGICVPAVLTERTYGEMERCFFLYGAACALLAGAAALLRRRRVRSGEGRKLSEGQGRKASEEIGQGRKPSEKSEEGRKPSEKFGQGRKAPKSRAGTALWVVFAALLGLQLFLLCFLAYNEGDDAYYVAITESVSPEKRMYGADPYTGKATDLKPRHALAPFPIWVALISRLSGLSAAATAHTALPLVLVPMTYCLYYLIGKKLFGGEKDRGGWETPLFLCFAALLVLFGGYSNFSAENFLLVRGAQGKSVLANLILPFLFYEMLCLLEKLERGEKMGIRSWVLIGLAMAAGCLCSTLGSLLTCILLGLFVVCVILAYRRWEALIGAAFCVAVPVLMACIYVVL